MNRPIRRFDNLRAGDCGLWYDVQADVNNTIVHHVCPYDECKSFDDAENYYYKWFYRKNHIPFIITHHKLGKEQIYQMSLAC